MNAAFVALTFILIIVIIFLARDMTEAMLIINLLVAFLVISAQFGLLSKNLLDITMQDSPAVPAQDSTASTAPAGVPSVADTFADMPTDDPAAAMYGPFYEQWHAYQDSYTSAYDAPKMVLDNGADQTHTVDEANALMAQQRARDRKCSDGWLVKDKYYYQHHYGGELNNEEHKAWWGRNEW